jgi:hypothetical protein
MSTVITPEEIQANLDRFNGSDTFTQWSPLLFRNSVLTEGALYLAENCGAYWLMDIIGSYQSESKFRTQNFQVWKLDRKGEGWLVTAEDGNGNVITRQDMGVSDFPLNGIEIWAIRNELGGLTLMLPSEY